MPPRLEPSAPPQAASVLHGYPQLQTQVRPKVGLKSGNVPEVESALHTPPGESSKSEISGAVGVCAQSTRLHTEVPVDGCNAALSAEAAPRGTGMLSVSRPNTSTVNQPNALSVFLNRGIVPSSFIRDRNLGHRDRSTGQAAPGRSPIKSQGGSCFQSFSQGSSGGTRRSMFELATQG